jgi:disulfide oxidoreductase YuzD
VKLQLVPQNEPQPEPQNEPQPVNVQFDVLHETVLQLAVWVVHDEFVQPVLVVHDECVVHEFVVHECVPHVCWLPQP